MNKMEGRPVTVRWNPTPRAMERSFHVVTGEWVFSATTGANADDVRAGRITPRDNPPSAVVERRTARLSAFSLVVGVGKDLIDRWVSGSSGYLGDDRPPLVNRLSQTQGGFLPCLQKL